LDLPFLDEKANISISTMERHTKTDWRGVRTNTK
jgi:hypothetical protein